MEKNWPVDQSITAWKKLTLGYQPYRFENYWMDLSRMASDDRSIRYGSKNEGFDLAEDYWNLFKADHRSDEEGQQELKEKFEGILANGTKEDLNTFIGNYNLEMKDKHNDLWHYFGRNPRKLWGFKTTSEEMELLKFEHDGKTTVIEKRQTYDPHEFKRPAFVDPHFLNDEVYYLLGTRKDYGADICCKSLWNKSRSRKLFFLKSGSELFINRGCNSN